MIVPVEACQCCGHLGGTCPRCGATHHPSYIDGCEACRFDCIDCGQLGTLGPETSYAVFEGDDEFRGYRCQDCERQ